MKNILATIDFYGSERLIIDKAFEIAKAFDAKIWLLHVVAPEPEFVGFGVGPQYVRDARATELKKEHRMLNQFADELELKGVKAQGLLLQGSKIEIIIKEAEKMKDIFQTNSDSGHVYEIKKI